MPLSGKVFRIAVVLVVAGLVAAGVVVVFGGSAQRNGTAYFTQAKGLYVGDDVQLLGVRIGKVTAITPEPGQVRVDFSYDADHPLPADAKAIIMAPSVVPVRDLTLTPVYRGGPQLADGASIPVSRTAVPVEWDDIKQQLDQLSNALGPQGANSQGALSQLLNTSAANLDGQGDNLNQTLRSLSEAMATLNDGGDDLFATVRNLQVFVDALSTSDAQVVDFNHRLASVASLLNGDSDELSTALNSLDSAFEQVTGFLKDNRQTLSDTVKDLQPLSDVLAKDRQKLADTLHFAPTALSNFYNIYDPLDGSLNGVLTTANLQAPAMFVCSAIYSFGGSPQDCQNALGPLAKLVTISGDIPLGVDAVDRNGRSNMVVARPGPEPPAGSPAAMDGFQQLMTQGSAG
ncbi:MCE family protein [Amycolatopsis sp.]|uniref:MCE family protein n=1 Tax=Amycolatopsis sp. TaxID=37632 RepID=UPI002CDFE463|nr:MCE family protein [Amycolatopsis sp.]HVV12667.1 MCE family protein [Amycolatopsis sp.]